MRTAVIGAAALAALLGGCDEPIASAAPGAKDQGRFAGIGVFDAGRLWAQMTGAPAPSDPASAGIADDEHIIVVLDSHTGEVRQCGDHSGYCVTMNPWKGNAAALPAKLAKHTAELDTAESDGSIAADNTVATTEE